MMTKKNYEALADALSSGACEYGFGHIVDNVCDVLESDNPRFDREKFFEAVFGPDGPL